jgi:hypothetical protein
MKTLRDPRDLESVLQRLRRVQAGGRPQWGRMSAPQMVCHLTDSFRGVLGERPASPASPASPPPLVQRTAVKWVALYAPMHWPHGIKTRPQADAELGGTRPTEFAADVASLEGACSRFLAAREPGARRVHFMFGELTDREWCRWAYLHMDHHLRQFGV